MDGFHQAISGQDPVKFVAALKGLQASPADAADLMASPEPLPQFISAYMSAVLKPDSVKALSNATKLFFPFFQTEDCKGTWALPLADFLAENVKLRALRAGDDATIESRSLS